MDRRAPRCWTAEPDAGSIRSDPRGGPSTKASRPPVRAGPASSRPSRAGRPSRPPSRSDRADLPKQTRLPESVCTGPTMTSTGQDRPTSCNGHRCLDDVVDERFENAPRCGDRYVRDPARGGARRGHRPVMGPDLLVATSDVVIGLVVAMPVLLVAGGVAVGLRLRGRGTKDHVPAGEVASDAPTDVELDRSADATRTRHHRRARRRRRPDARGGRAERPAPVEPAEPVEPGPSRRASHLPEPAGQGPRPAVGLPGCGPVQGQDRRRHLGRPRGGAHPGRCRGRRHRLAPRRPPDRRSRTGEIAGPDALVDALKADLVSMLTAGRRLAGRARVGAAEARSRRGDRGDGPERAGPVDVWLFVGVNGVGKTTTVGKVASRHVRLGDQGAAGRGRHLPGRRR